MFFPLQSVHQQLLHPSPHFPYDFLDEETVAVGFAHPLPLELCMCGSVYEARSICVARSIGACGMWSVCMARLVSNVVPWQTIGWHIRIDHMAHIYVTYYVHTIWGTCPML